jgi:IS1 family transposase
MLNDVIPPKRWRKPWKTFFAYHDHLGRFTSDPCRATSCVSASQFGRAYHGTKFFRISNYTGSQRNISVGGADYFSHDPSAFRCFGTGCLSNYGDDGTDEYGCLQQSYKNQVKIESSHIPVDFYIFIIPPFAFLMWGGALLFDNHRYWGSLLVCIGCAGFLSGSTSLLLCDPLFWRALANGVRGAQCDRCETEQYCEYSKPTHNRKIVPRKHLTGNSYWGTVIDMANVLSTDKQIAIIGALTEGSSIRSIERITGVHRDTIMRLGVKVGQGCAKMLDSSMRDLPCNRLEMDEIWGFIGKKDRNVREGDDGVGSIWTFCAIDAETKLVPAFKCGNRDAATAKAFVQDVANRMAYRVQISTDGLNAYVAAMQSAFGEFVDYGQIIKTYGHEEVSDNRRYSAPKFVSAEKKTVIGIPDERLISTSYVERLNGTTRLHMRRLTRLTLAFSKKRENFEAAVALHFAYYNFVKRHNTLRCTPAMAAGVTSTFWKVGDLLEATA